MQQVDLIIIGSGPGGYVVAAEAAAKGLDVVVFEKDKLGGTCLNRGCIPTKCLCAAAERIDAVRNASDFGVNADIVNIDFEKIHQRTTGIVDQLRSDIELSLSKVRVVHGEASLGTNGTVLCGDETFAATKILIATGSRPAELPIPGIEHALNSDDVLKLTDFPQNITIIGGGVIGLEFASILCAFGCTVTVVEYCKEILPGFDKDIAKRLRSYLSRRGIKFVCGAKVISVGEDKTVEYEAKNRVQTVPSDMVISAVGRRAVLPEGCADAGVEVNERGFIAVNEAFETSAPNIYAVGDVNGKCMLAHAATAQARKALWGTAYDQPVPGVVFTEPECAAIGLTVDNAPENLEAKEVKLPYSSNGKAFASGTTDGLFKLVFDSRNGKILGCHVVGAHASDLVAEISVAIKAGLTVRQLAYDVIHAHPSISEIVATACETAEGLLEN